MLIFFYVIIACIFVWLLCISDDITFSKYIYLLTGYLSMILAQTNLSACENLFATDRILQSSVLVARAIIKIIKMTNAVMLL